MRIIQDSWEGTFIYLTSGSLAQVMYHFKSYFSVKEITSIFAHSHQIYIIFFKKYLQKQGLCQIQLHLFCTTSDTIQGESNIELGANYSGLKLKDNINLLNASDHLNQMVNIKFQCDEYSETRQGFRDQIGKKKLLQSQRQLSGLSGVTICATASERPDTI